MSFLQVLLSGVIAGVILLQATIVAPVLFKNLSAKDAGPVLRAIFPRLFGLAFAFGLLALVVSVADNQGLIPKAVFLFTVVAMAICYLIIPATNSAKDAGNEGAFKKLHTLSVVLTMIVLITNITCLLYTSPSPRDRTRSRMPSSA